MAQNGFKYLFDNTLEISHCVIFLIPGGIDKISLLTAYIHTISDTFIETFRTLAHGPLQTVPGYGDTCMTLCLLCQNTAEPGEKVEEHKFES